MTESPVPQFQKPELKCTAPGHTVHRIFSETSMDVRAHTGSIIKITNAPVPYNIVGILNDNGNAFIPQVPMNTKITFSMYDPVTGLYDPNVGTYTTGSTPGGFDRPILLFQPTTEIRRIAMRIGETKHDSVSLDWQRIDYLLNVTAIDTGKMINVGFEANALLSVRLEDPQGNLIIDNTNTNCYLGKKLHLNRVGTYKIRVALGTSILPGSFTIGVNYYPYLPLGNLMLCGEMVYDTLYQRLSPYLIPEAVWVPAGDTLIVEPGVEINFNTGASLRVEGLLEGTATEEDPIVLRPATMQHQGGTDIRAVKSVEVVRKEGGK
jgi:hypothetical protein